ncbi:MAG: hypothetical protein Q8L99_01950 [Polycyclovorans sp.]|nr:hypothetical protein [Polycyclovorans sp.]MEC8847942.1 hypothetical protein [Pseudomonadota bacterium]
MAISIAEVCHAVKATPMTCEVIEPLTTPHHDPCGRQAADDFREQVQ